MSDWKSTGNLRKHAQLCWGDDTIKGANACADLKSACNGLAYATKLRDGSITMAFERKGKGKLTFSLRQHTKAETRFVQPSLIRHTWWGIRAELIHWISKSLRPFTIVSDHTFQCLMKTGRPAYYIPSASTVACDVKQVYTNVRIRLTTMLQVWIPVSQIKPEDQFDLPYAGTWKCPQLWDRRMDFT